MASWPAVSLSVSACRYSEIHAPLVCAVLLSADVSKISPPRRAFRPLSRSSSLMRNDLPMRDGPMQVTIGTATCDTYIRSASHRNVISDSLCAAALCAFSSDSVANSSMISSSRSGRKSLAATPSIFCCCFLTSNLSRSRAHTASHSFASLTVAKLFMSTSVEECLDRNSLISCASSFFCLHRAFQIDVLQKTFGAHTSQSVSACRCRPALR